MNMACPCCAGPKTRHAFSTRPMPVAAALLLRSAEAARNLPRRALDLWHCESCGFLWNASFAQDLVRYDDDYEGTQIHSPHFARYLDDLARRWAARFAHPIGRVLELGCGQAEFLAALAPHVAAELIGYDPALRTEVRRDTLELHAEFLPQRTKGQPQADVVISRMTLEHIAAPAAFVALQRDWLAPKGLLITQVPNANDMIARSAVCELQYEHVNYFTPASLHALMRGAGLLSVATEIDYADQHLSVFARFGAAKPAPAPIAMPAGIGKFMEVHQAFGGAWHERILAARLANQEVWLWGAGSRATALCAHIPKPGLLSGVIDVNPRRAGCYVPGVAVQTFAPEHLRGKSNLCVIIMNDVYKAEIAQRLAVLGVAADIYCL